MSYDDFIEKIGFRANAAADVLGNLCADEKNKVLVAMADALMKAKSNLRAVNAEEVNMARDRGVSAALCDRLTLTDDRIDAMAEGLRTVAKLPDPVGTILSHTKQLSGIEISKVRVPLGVILMIYEARPNVTVDAAGLCFKSGNAIVLRGGREALHSNTAIAYILRDTLAKHNMPEDAIQFIEEPDHSLVEELLRADHLIDVVIPRGGKELIHAVAERSRIPVLKHYEGICHTYVSAHADTDMAVKIALNAKVQRPGVCNAMETLLVDEKIAATYLPVLLPQLRDAGVELRGCERTCALDERVAPATEDDWVTEYLDLILSIKIVNGVEDAIAFINRYGSHHSDAIVSDDIHEAAHFLRAVHSAAVYVNASTRFTDGAEFGLGAEMGISTDKLHARGPVGLEELTSYKYIIRGTGTIRE